MDKIAILLFLYSLPAFSSNESSICMSTMPGGQVLSSPAMMMGQSYIPQASTISIGKKEMIISSKERGRNKKFVFSKQASSTN